MKYVLIITPGELAYLNSLQRIEVNPIKNRAILGLRRKARQQSTAGPLTYTQARKLETMVLDMQASKRVT